MLSSIVKAKSYCHDVTRRSCKFCHVINNMRAIRKRKCICCLLLVLLVVVTLMLTQTIVLDIATFTSEEFQSDVPAPNTVPLPGQLSYLGFLVRDNVTHAPATCAPVRNIAFVKTHKAGSSTIANVLQRYGITNNLNFALPNTKLHSYGYNYISRAGEVLSKKYVYPLPEGEEYNILFNHAIYNRTAFRMIMPGDAVYITILREPFQQFVSTFEYYHVDRFIGKRVPSLINATNPVSTYLATPRRFERGPSMFSYIKNKQAEDLGLRKEQFFSNANLKEYISLMDEDFKLVMILEYFDESLLLLKHELCWTIQDILYIPLNANKKKPVRNFTDADHENHRRMSHLDYALYYHFLKVFAQKLKAQSPDFFRELAHFKKLLEGVKGSCRSGTSLVVSETRWNHPFVIDRRDCELMLMSELAGLDLLYKRAGRVPGFEKHPTIVRQGKPSPTREDKGKSGEYNPERVTH
ncbi:unnamed protein product [Lymnaea stagnalis]|uniref:Galactosylceramide sulfotransferase-like n=1 Tax=Lymnaea stagnalis TaxID=6523 RepID=A0AAV2IPX7_LYMST